MIFLLLACGNVKDTAVLAELDEGEAGSICIEAEPEATNCGTPFDLDACAADVLALPDSCGTTVGEWFACREAYDQLSCDPPFEVPDACAWTLEETCLLQAE